jgi:type IV secretion system protein VirB10
MLRPPAPGPVARLSEPALVVDLAAAANAQAEQQETERITVLRRRASVIPQGTLIPAVLETPIDSPSSGPVRAITSTDTRGFDGMRVLIPRGSRLIGDYRGDSQAGQDRLLVTWTRLIRPDGISVRLTSAATDPAGGAGIPGVVNEHLLGRFANVALQTAINVGVDLASRSGNGSVIINGPGQALGGVGETLVPSATLKPTIRVRAGAQINVFVARDLDFSGALPRP